MYNMYDGPNSAQYVGAACCYAGSVHGTTGTMLAYITVMLVQHIVVLSADDPE